MLILTKEIQQQNYYLSRKEKFCLISKGVKLLPHQKIIEQIEFLNVYNLSILKKGDTK